MSNELFTFLEYTGATVYGLLRDIVNGKVRDVVAGAWDTWVDADIGTYDIAITHIGGGAFVGSMPAGISEGDYVMEYREQQGGSPSFGNDSLLGWDPIDWTGSAMRILKSVQDKTDGLNFTGSDVKATLDGETVVTDATSRTASKANVSSLATTAALSTHDTDIKNAIVSASPQQHSSESSNDTTGEVDSGTYVDTATINNTYWAISPVTPAVNGFGLNMDLVFGLGTGLDRVPSVVSITGYFNANPARSTNVWAWNYITNSWDQLSGTGTVISHGTSNANYQYPLTNNHIQASDGEVKIRFTSTSTTTGDVLYLDYVAVSSLAVEAAGLTAEAIANAVASHNIMEHQDHDSLGFRVALPVINIYDVTTSDSALSFTCSGLPAVTNNFQYHRIRVHDEINNINADSWIASMNDSGVVILGRALSFIPDTDSEIFIMEGLISPAEIQTQIEGSGSTLGTIAADVAGIDGQSMRGTDGANTTTPDNTGISEIQIQTDKLDNMIEENSAGNMFTTAALSNVVAQADTDAIVTAILAATGVTAGGNWSLAKVLKINAAWEVGKWRDKPSTPDTYQLLDPDDGTTVILELTLSATTPYKSVTILI